MLEFMEYISSKEDKNIPSCYIDVLFEVAKNTPIVGIMQSNSRMFIASLKSFLDGSVNIFEDKDVLDHLYDEVPVVIEIISKIIKYEKAEFLPEPVRGIFEFMLKLLNQVQKLATLRHVPAKKYIGKEPYTEFFPSLPLHSEKITFKVDKENFHDDE